MYEQTMRQLAYIASEMCYFASVDVRHLMRFCLHDKGGFWKPKLSMAVLERLLSQLNSVYTDCFGDETCWFWEETKIISISYI